LSLRPSLGEPIFCVTISATLALAANPVPAGLSGDYPDEHRVAVGVTALFAAAGLASTIDAALDYDVQAIDQLCSERPALAWERLSR
jgi:hypothetical protein